MRGRRGFALLAALWLVVALGGLAAGAAAHARLGTASSAERVGALRARWAAEGCLAAALARLDSVVRLRADFALPVLDTVHYANGATCDVSVADPGAQPGSPYGDGRLNANSAPDSVLLALPGMGPDAVRALAAARTWRRPIASLEELMLQLPPPARAELAEHYPDLVGRLTFQATSLALTARGWTAQGTAAKIELHVAPAGGRAAVLARRLW